MRKTPLKRGGRIKPKKRSASEFQRIYHSKERVAWVKSLRCCHCLVLGQSENAHTVNGGRGRKAGYGTIVPLCHTHHRWYDEYREPFGRFSEVRQTIKAYADAVAAGWREHKAIVDAQRETQRIVNARRA